MASKLRLEIHRITLQKQVYDDVVRLVSVDVPKVDDDDLPL